MNLFQIQESIHKVINPEAVYSVYFDATKPNLDETKGVTIKLGGREMINLLIMLTRLKDS